MGSTKSVPSPIQVIARDEGGLNLRVGEGVMVKRDEIIGYLDGAGDVDTILELERRLNSATSDETESRFPEKNIGYLQPYVAAWRLAVVEFNLFRQHGIQAQVLAELSTQERNYQEMLMRATEQLRIAELEFSLISEKFHRDSLLFVSELLSEEQFNVTKLDILRESRELTAHRHSKNRLSVRNSELVASISETNNNYKEKLSFLEQKCIESKNLLLSEIAKWKEQKIFQAPIDGKVFFSAFQEQGHPVKSGEHLFTVLPTSNV